MLLLKSCLGHHAEQYSQSLLLSLSKEACYLTKHLKTDENKEKQK